MRVQVRPIDHESPLALAALQPLGRGSHRVVRAVLAPLRALSARLRVRSVVRAAGSAMDVELFVGSEVLCFFCQAALFYAVELAFHGRLPVRVIFDFFFLGGLTTSFFGRLVRAAGDFLSVVVRTLCPALALVQKLVGGVTALYTLQLPLSLRSRVYVQAIALVDAQQ